MPKYTYQGEMGRLSARTKFGAVVLLKGVEVELTDDQHKALADHPVFTALEKSGELIISEVKKTKPNSKADTAAAKAKREAELVEVKVKLTELNVEFSDDESLEDLQAKLAAAK
ncbi:hypothetical protein N5D44_11140 [Acinetobacter junii]|uniref:hypothetical protein n=1 Tax=Acinetobacter junii TaxID=40215 RepID=UPI00244D19F6|nr:hypothetical protein [Acinetobacter junii]MDH1858845.1 hypothetical protein [Acinetobacter junii]